MKHSYVWILSVLLALLCVGTGLALYFSRGWEQAESPAPEQSESQPVQTEAGSDPEASEAPATVVPSDVPEEDSEEDPDRPNETPTGGTGASETESDAPAPSESDTPAPGEHGMPVSGGHVTSAPQQSIAPAPVGTPAPQAPGLSAAPAPTGSGAPSLPETQTPRPTGSAAPATQSPASPAPGASAAPEETALPTVSIPTMPPLPVETGASEEAKRINELYAQLSELRSEAVSQLTALADQAEAEWLAIRDKHPSRKEFVLRYFNEGTELEASYDAQVDTLCNELQFLLNKTGGDTSLVRQIRAEYEAEKESARAAYYRRFMAMLNLD